MQCDDDPCSPDPCQGKGKTDPLRLFTDLYTKNIHFTELGSGQTWGTHSQKRRAFLQEPPPRVCRARAMLATAPARSGLSVRKSVDPFADLLRRPVLRQIRSVYQDRLGTSREKGSVLFSAGPNCDQCGPVYADYPRCTDPCTPVCLTQRSPAPPPVGSRRTSCVSFYFRNISDACLFPEPF